MARRLIVTTALVALVPAATAQAHAELERTVPASHQALDAGPSMVSLTFSEPVQAPDGALQVADADGHTVSGPVQVSGSTVAVRVPRHLDAGKYRVSWRVVSDDGHVVGGGYRFKIRAVAPGREAPAPTPVPAPAHAQAAVALSTLLLVGGLATAAAALVGGIAVRRRRRLDTPETWLGDVALLALGVCIAVPLFMEALR